MFESHGLVHNRGRYITLTIIACLVCVMVSCALCGCLESDILVNHVLDQKNGEVDYSNPDKVYVPDDTAKTTVDDIEATSQKALDDLKKAIKDRAAYDDKSNTDKKSESTSYKDTANSLSTTAKKKASDKGKTDETGSKKSKGKDGGTDSKKTGDDTNQSNGGNTNASVNPSNNVYDSSYGNITDLPTDLSGVCAVGEAANMVLAIAGKGALVGSSADFLSDSNVKKVFSGRSIDKVKTCWLGDGLNDKDAKIDAMTSLKPDAVLEVSGTDTLSSAQEAALGKAGIRVIVLPAMTSDTYIRAAVTVIGKIFSDSTKGASEELAREYDSTVDSVLGMAESAHGGGVATYNQRDYNDSDNNQKTTTNVMSDPNWSIFITDWDSSATVSGSFNGSTLFSNVKGVASTYTGWSWSPISYYMSCGGTINNSAAYGDAFRTTAKRAFLQYNENQINYTWSVKPSGVKLSSDGGTFDQNSGLGILANGYDAYAAKENSAHPLGQSDFNKVFVRTTKIKDALEKAQSSGLYKPRSWTSVGKLSGYGVEVSGKLLHAYTVNPNSSRGDTGYSIVVNPEGMTSSWYAGGMESYLESLWISHVYYPSKVSKSDVISKVEDFYSTFYGYALSDSAAEKILNGSYAS